MTERSSLFAASPAKLEPADAFWYHVMDLPGIGTTEGLWDLRGQFDKYIASVDLAGKSFLDIGCANGFLSFSAEQAGAREVVSFDIDKGESQHLLPFKDSLYFRDHGAWAVERSELFRQWKVGYWLAHRALNSKAKVFYGNVYEIPPELGAFDVVLVGAVLEHLSDPIRALASISRVAAHTLIINTEIFEAEGPVAKFAGDASKPDVDYVFWVYSLEVYRQVLAMLGFRIVTVQKDLYRYRVLDGCFPRSAILAERVGDTARP